MPYPKAVASKVYTNREKQCAETVAVVSRVWFRIGKLMMLFTGRSQKRLITEENYGEGNSSGIVSFKWKVWLKKKDQKE